MKLEFYWQIFEKHSNIKLTSNFMKIDQWKLSYSMQIDRWTDMMKLTVANCNFVNTPKKYKMYKGWANMNYNL